MKTNLYALLCLSLYACHMYASDHKITQIIHVEQENTPLQASNQLFYVTKNHELYYANEYDIEKTVPTKVYKCTLYEQSTKDNKYRPVDNVMLIGQPRLIDNTWSMPAIIKQKGIFGRILRPDICLIKYKENIEIKQIIRESEPFFKPSETFEAEEETEDIFVIQRLAEGHRTKVTKIGFLSNYNTFLIVSNSEWPTVKIHDNLSKPKLVADIPLTHLFYIVNNKYLRPSMIRGLAEPNLLHNEFTFQNFIKEDIYFENIPPFKNTFSFNIEPTKISYLPTMFFDQTQDYTNTFIQQTLQNYFYKAAKNQKIWKNSTCFISTDYAIIFLPNSRTCMCYKKIGDAIAFHLDYEEILLIRESNVITACTYDFNTQTLFYATYDKKQHKTSLAKQVLNPLK